MFRRVALLALAAAPFVFPLDAEASIHCDRWARSALPLEELSHGTNWLSGNIEWEAGIQTIVSASLGNDAKPTLWLMPADQQTSFTPINLGYEFSVGRSEPLVLYSAGLLGPSEVVSGELIWSATGL